MSKLLELFGIIFSLIVVFMLEKRDEEEKNTKTQLREDARKTLLIYCERINNVYYAWIKDTYEFIGQSESPDELSSLLVTRYPSQNYNVIIEEKVA